MLYHVSSTPGIRVLQPRVSSHGKAYVYAIENLVTGLLFGVPHDDFDFMLTADDSGLPSVYECYPDAFRQVYSGKACTVYQVQEEGFLRGVTGWNPELVCEREVEVLSESHVPDVYARLLEAEADGKLILYRYCDAPEYKKLISEHIADRLIRFRKLDSQDPRILEHFGKIVDGLKAVMDGHLMD